MRTNPFTINLIRLFHQLYTTLLLMCSYLYIFLNVIKTVQTDTVILIIPSLKVEIKKFKDKPQCVKVILFIIHSKCEIHNKLLVNGT